MNRIRVKICGITRPEDAIKAAELGVDAIGLVFCSASPRYVSKQQANAIIAALPPFVTVVALLMDAEAEFIQDIVSDLSIDLLQFHGNETPEECEKWGIPYIKAIPMLGNQDPAIYASAYGRAAGYLLDAIKPGQAGGRGEEFDWNQIPQLNKPLILAGGLHPDNVREAILKSRCYAVDVSSGVESAKGIKSAEKMQQFVEQVNKV